MEGNNRKMNKLLKEILSTSVYLLVVLLITFLIVIVSWPSERGITSTVNNHFCRIKKVSQMQN